MTVSTPELRVAVCQMTSVDNWQANVQQALDLAEKALKQGPLDLICFPENALYMRLERSQKVPSVELSDAIFDPFVELAKRENCWIYFGSVPLKMEGKVFNASVVISEKGVRSAPYKKVHLFDIQLKGEAPVRESDEFAHGDKPAIINIRGWKIGMSICYDVRFSELYGAYQSEPVDLICVPSAFLVKTGQAHWHVLLRARAIEAQAYVVAAAQAGSHRGLRETYGHSLVVDPWGQVVAEGTLEEPVKVAVLKKERIAAVREQIPMADHRRL